MSETRETPGASMTEAYDWRGRTVVDTNDEKVGNLEEVYLDEQTGQPEWALVTTGLFGTKSNFVPLAGAQPAGENVRLAFTKEEVTGSPKIDADQQLSTAEEAELYRHYGLKYPDAEPADAGRSEDTGDDAMTRSEEELRVGKAQREKGRVRLRKYVVTDEVEQTVPVRREEVRVEREPITDANVDQATSGPEISESEHEVELYEEEPVVEKRTVPKERVRLEKDVHVDEEPISEQVRKERIDVEEER